MDADAAFLAEIEAAPTDNVRRLVYADWLEERQDERAEFLRLLVAARELPSFEHDSFAALHKRLCELRPVDPRWLARVGHVVGPQEATSANFEDILQWNQRVVLQYWAEWCGPCRQMRATMAEVADRLEGWLVVYQCDIDEQAEMAQQGSVTSIPTIAFFRSGQACGKMIGAQPVEKFMTEIATTFGYR